MAWFHNCRLWTPTDGPGLLLSSRHRCLCINPLGPAPLVLEGFLSPSRHWTTVKHSTRRNREAASAPHEPPVAWVTKPVADARGKGRRRQKISSRNPSQEFVQHSKSTCPDQGLGHVLIHHYGNTASPPRQEYQNYPPQFQPRPFQAPLEIIVRIFSSWEREDWSICFSNLGLYIAGSRSAGGTVNFISTLGWNCEVA